DEAAAWRQLDEAGIRVVTVRDNPRFGFDVPACVEEGPAEACSRARAEIYSPVNPVLGARGVPASAAHLDLTPYFCSTQRCDGVVGNVLVYRDDNHVTATYAATLAAPLHEALRTTATWLFRDTTGLPGAAAVPPSAARPGQRVTA